MPRGSLIAVAFALMASAPIFGADLTGVWKASFDTQIGVQNYTYTFKQEGTKLTGSAKSDNGDVQIMEGTVNGDDVSFVENLNFQGMDLRIVYKGKVSGDEIKFTRNILDMFMEDLVAKKQK